MGTFLQRCFDFNSGKTLYQESTQSSMFYIKILGWWIRTDLGSLTVCKKNFISTFNFYSDVLNKVGVLVLLNICGPSSLENPKQLTFLHGQPFLNFHGNPSLQFEERFSIVDCGCKKKPWMKFEYQGKMSPKNATPLQEDDILHKPFVLWEYPATSL